MTAISQIDLITQFRATMIEHYPYLARYVYGLTPVPRPGMGTMAVDLQGHMYYDPDWVQTLTLEQGGYVCLHEAWHLILRHCHRSRDIIGDNPTKQQLHDLNIAADIIVWEMLEPIADKAPGDHVNLLDCQARWPEIERNMTLQQLYKIIHDTPPEEQEQKGQPEQGEGQPQEENGDNPGEEKIDDRGFKDVVRGSAADGIRKDFEDLTNDAWDSYVENSMLEQVEEAIQELEESSEKWNPSRGNIPGRLKRVIRQRLHPTVNPWDKLRGLIARSLSQHRGKPEPTFMLRNRRQSVMQRGVVLAGNRKHMPTATVIMDTSGSMTAACLAKAAAVCSQGVRAVGQYRLICWDFCLQLDEVVKSQQINWPAPGGGGTCMKRAIEFALQKPTDVIICVTDGGTDWPDTMPANTKLVIALTQDSPTPSYATTVRINDPGTHQEEGEE